MLSILIYCDNILYTLMSDYFVAEYVREIFAQFSKSEFVNQSILGADVVVVNGRVEEVS